MTHRTCVQLSLESNRTEASELEGKILGYNALIESKKGDILRKRDEFDIQNADTRKTLKEILKKQEETLQKQEEQTQHYTVILHLHMYSYKVCTNFMLMHVFLHVQIVIDDILKESEDLKRNTQLAAVTISLKTININARVHVNM